MIHARKQRTKVDDAQVLQELVDKHYPPAVPIRLVQDNLNTHSPASFYEAFPAAEAFRLAQKIEPHYTPKKGSWVNMAEIELAALTKQCLDRRIGDIQTLAQEVRAWAQKRNQIRATVRWNSTKNDARKKFQKHYHVQN